MIGERFGPWTLEKQLGHGGMGAVWLGRSGDRVAAVKVLHAALAQEPGFVDRFIREIEALHELKDEHIVQFLDSGVQRGQPWYAMEFVDGPSLAQLLEERGALPWDETLKIAIQICKALQAAHQREMIHRDLKPSNLLLTKDGIVKLADFGVAKLFAAAKITLEDTVLGTPDYIAPEQATGRPVTKRSDLYSLGVVLYHLLTGRLPFLAETQADMVHQHKHGTFDPPSKHVADLPHELDVLVGELLAKEPEKRPASAAIVADVIGRLQRKMVRKRQYTVDATRGAPTKVIGPAADEQVRARAGRGAAAFPEIKPVETTPWGRLALLGVALAAVVAALVWVLQPPSPEKLLSQAAVHADGGLWTDAELTLEKLKAKHPEHPFGPQATDLAARVAAGKEATKLKREAGAFAVAAPTCEAERLYRRGVVEFLNGKGAEAKRTWAMLALAYQGLPTQESWVKLAQAALAEAEKPATTLTAFEAALKKAETEPRDEAAKRLAALADLYRGDADRPEIRPLLDEVNARLAKLRGP